MSEPNRQPLKPKPWDQGGEADHVSFGGWLRRQREVREISLREIAETSKISIRYLEALEKDRFELLPAVVFAKGFLREYAKFVGLDPDEVVNYYLAAQGQMEPEVEEIEGVESSPATHHWTHGLWLVAGVVLLLSLVWALSFLANRRSEGAEAVPAIAAPVPQPAAQPARPEDSGFPLSPLRVTLDFTQNCWVDAFVDGERRISELRVQGESLQIDASEEVRLSLNRAAGVNVQVNGRPFSVTAGDNEMFVIDLPTARSLGDPR